ncbi:MAG: hypothetical protein JWN00_4152 [Actinomycetia bacterium]|nr:hypothetical protein [Actinomycetes bacterium]
MVKYSPWVSGSGRPAEGGESMEFWKTVFGLACRRYVGLPVLGFSLIAAGLTYLLLPTHYVSSAAVVLTTPTGGGTQAADPTKSTGLTNPLLQFNASLRTTAGIIIISMNGPDVKAAMGISPGSGTTITINDGSTVPELLAVSTNGPFVYIQVDSLSPATATATVSNAEQMVRNLLADQQRLLKAPKSTYITVTEVSAPTAPHATRTTQWTVAGGAFAATLCLGLSIAYGADRALRNRRRRVRPTLRIGQAPGAHRPTVVMSTDHHERDSSGYTLTLAKERAKGSSSGPVPEAAAPDPARAEPAWTPWVGEDTVAMPIVVADDGEAGDGGLPTGIGSGQDGYQVPARPANVAKGAWYNRHRAG